MRVSRPSPPASLRRAAEVLREGGLGHLLLRALSKLSAPLLDAGSVYFFVRDLQGNVPESPAVVGFAFRQAFASDLDGLLEGSDPQRSGEELRERLRRGDLCFIAVDPAGSVAASCWVAAQRDGIHIPELDSDLVLGPADSYWYDVYTRPDVRGRGIGDALQAFAHRHLQAAGFKRVYSYVAGANPIGLRLARHRQQAAARLWYLRLRGRKPWLIGRREIRWHVVSLRRH